MAVWRVENFEAVPVAENEIGSFYAGDSYIVKHSMVRGTAVVDTYYIWQGSRSSADEKGAAVLLAKDMAGIKGGKSPLIRVVMKKEPDYFLALFGGSMVVLQVCAVRHAVWLFAGGYNVVACSDADPIATCPGSPHSP